MPQAINHLLALDMGDKRVGVALADSDTKIPRPLITLSNDQDLVAKLQELIKQHQVSVVVIGLPRNLSGDDSLQTAKVRHNIDELSRALDGIEVVTEDEALSSVRAEEELRARGKIFAKADIDKLAAAFILEDYLAGLKS